MESHKIAIKFIKLHCSAKYEYQPTKCQYGKVFQISVFLLSLFSSILFHEVYILSYERSEKKESQKMFLPFDPQILLMEIYPNEMQVKLFVIKYLW